MRREKVGKYQQSGGTHAASGRREPILTAGRYPTRLAGLLSRGPAASQAFNRDAQSTDNTACSPF